MCLLLYQVPSANRDYNASLLTSVDLNGLKPEHKRSEIQFAPKTVEAVRKQANISEQTLTEEATPGIANTHEKSDMDLLCEKVDRVLEVKAGLQQQVYSQQTWKRMRHQRQTGAPQKSYQDLQQQPQMQQRPQLQRQQNSSWECMGCKGRTSISHLTDQPKI